MLRKYALLIGLTLVSCLTGCREADDGSKPTAVNQERPIELTFWHIIKYEGPKEVIEQAVHQFETSHPDTRVTIQTFANDAYKTKLAVEMVSGTPPDILFTWGEDLSRKSRLPAALPI